MQVVQRFTFLNCLCALLVSDNTEIYFTVPQPKLTFYNISYQSAFCGATNWTVPKVDQNFLERFEMRCCRRIVDIIWTDRSRNEDILQRIAENRNILHTIKQNKRNWTRHQFTTLNQQNAWNYSLDIYVTLSTGYFWMKEKPT
jgi:hypothetical protein